MDEYAEEMAKLYKELHSLKNAHILERMETIRTQGNALAQPQAQQSSSKLETRQAQREKGKPKTSYTPKYLKGKKKRKCINT